MTSDKAKLHKASHQQYWSSYRFFLVGSYIDQRSSSQTCLNQGSFALKKFARVPQIYCLHELYLLTSSFLRRYCFILVKSILCLHNWKRLHSTGFSILFMFKYLRKIQPHTDKLSEKEGVFPQLFQILVDIFL